MAGDDEGAEAAAPAGGAIGSGQDDEDVGVDVRAEVLVPEEPPLVAVLHRPRGVGPDVAPPLALGQEHPALPGVGRVDAAKAPDHVGADRRGGVALDDVGGARRHAQAAVDGRLRLGDQVGEGGAHDGRGRPSGVGLEADESVADEVGLVVGPCGVVDDLVDLVAPAIVAPQCRSVLVRLLGPGGDDPADEGAEAAHVVLGEGPVGGIGEVPVEEEGEVGIHPVPIEADGLVELGVVGKHAPMVGPTCRDARRPIG